MGADSAIIATRCLSAAEMNGLMTEGRLTA
jgi:hypothetical protein